MNEQTIRHGSMFSGIEGFGLGFKMAGWDTELVWQSEIDPYCNALNAKRFPYDTAQLGDIRTASCIPKVDVLTAGFPCQPASQAGKGLAQDDPRWLWPQVRRVVEMVQPRILIAENVRGLKARGLSIVLQDLADLGYDAQWDLIPAWAVGAPHLRHRFWIVAYPKGEKMGRLFDIPPTVYRWPDEEPCKPRLSRNAPNRRERLTALGNAVVPHAVCYVAERILDMQGGLIPPLLVEPREISSFDGKPPYAGILINGAVYEQPTSSPRTAKLRLWPTAAANDGQWGADALAACVHVDGTPASDPHMRFYHPTTGQIVQRTLHNYVVGVDAGLWDEPSDVRVWPTPKAADGENKSEQGFRFYAGKGDNPTLLGAARRAEGVSKIADDDPRLWPTPKSSPSGPDFARAGRERSGGDDLATAVVKHERTAETGTALAPEWVEWLMGYPPGWTAA